MTHSEKTANDPREIPSFARSFPRDPELDALVASFARGDYAAVRSGARELASKSSDDEVKAAARTLVVRTQPDPTAKALIALATVLLVVLSAWWIVHGHAPR